MNIFVRFLSVSMTTLNQMALTCAITPCRSSVDAEIPTMDLLVPYRSILPSSVISQADRYRFAITKLLKATPPRREIKRNRREPPPAGDLFQRASLNVRLAGRRPLGRHQLVSHARAADVHGPVSRDLAPGRLPVQDHRI